MDGKGATTTYTYDDARRLTDATFADGTAYAFEFDELGRRTVESSSAHTRGFTYDAVGRVKTVTDGQTGAVVTSGYDGEGRRTLVSEGGVDRRFEYDARGQVRRLRMGTSGWLDVTHDALGRRTSVTRPNGVRSDWVYDEAGQLKAVLHTKAGVVVEGFSYAYDSHGMRVSKTRFDGTSEAYGYDGADRLVRVDESSGRNSQYELDFVGNRTNLVVTQGSQVTSTSSVSNAFNQLTFSTRNGGGLPSLSTAYVYDNNGNLTSETADTAATTYTWDADNRLRQVTQPSLLSSYEYDARGMRTKKVEAGIETRFLLDGASVLSEYDATNVAAHRYLQNPESIDDILEFADGGAFYFPLTDALGSVVSITDSTGAVVRRNSYEVYGARTSTGTGPDWAFGFTGREHDDSGWRYQRGRYGASRTGSWAQPDRKRTIDGSNRYLYVNNKPAQGRDPSGREIWYGGAGSGVYAALGRATIQTETANLKAFSALGGWIVSAVEQARTVFSLQDASLGYNSRGAKRHGQIGHPQDAHFMAGCVLRTVGMDIGIDIDASATVFDRNNATEAGIRQASAEEARFADLAAVIAHELIHALQYISATEKHGMRLMSPDVDLVLLRAGLAPEQGYYGSLAPLVPAPPAWSTVTTNQHNSAGGFDSDARIYEELNQ